MLERFVRNNVFYKIDIYLVALLIVGLGFCGFLTWLANR